MSFFNLQSPVESPCWWLAPTSKHSRWKSCQKATCTSCTDAEDTCLQLPTSQALCITSAQRHISSCLCSPAVRYETRNLLLTQPIRGLSGQLLFLGRFGSRWEELNAAGEATEQNGSQTAKGMLRRAWVSGAPAPHPGREAVSRVQRQGGHRRTWASKER